MQRESSIDTDDLNQLNEVEQQEVQQAGYEAEEDDEDADLPPGRIHATRSASALRLKGSKAAMSLPNIALTSETGSVGSGGSGSGHSSSQQQMPSSSQRKAVSSSGLGLPPDSGHASPRSKSPKVVRGGTASTADGNSSISSLEDLVDSDILYDRAGLQDELSNASSDNLSTGKARSKSRSNLPPVNERLSEETLEDVHAFSDAKVASASHATSNSSAGGGSRANSSVAMNADGERNLDPLEECSQEEDADSLGSLDDPSESHEMPPVILTNIENLSLQAPQQDANAGTLEQSLGTFSAQAVQPAAAPQAAPSAEDAQPGNTTNGGGDNNHA